MMEIIIKTCYVVSIIWVIIGVISFPVLIFTGGNYWLSIPIVLSAEIPAILGLSLAVIDYLKQ